MYVNLGKEVNEKFKNPTQNVINKSGEVSIQKISEVLRRLTHFLTSYINEQ